MGKKKIKKTLAVKLLIAESGKKTFILVKIFWGEKDNMVLVFFFFIYFFFPHNFLKHLVFWVHVESCKHTHCSPKTCFVISIKIPGEDGSEKEA